eukprot:6141938-Amphidinium_carterae.1
MPATDLESCIVRQQVQMLPPGSHHAARTKPPQGGHRSCESCGSVCCTTIRHTYSVDKVKPVVSDSSERYNSEQLPVDPVVVP